MINISNTLLSYVDRGLAPINNSTAINNNTSVVEVEHESLNLNNYQEINYQEINSVTISSEARHALQLEKQEAKQQFLDEQLANSIEKSDRQKVQAQENIELYIEAAQRYSQQNILPPAVENRQAISAYSLIENRVIPTNASKGLES